jgi:hypothetical protein
MAGLSGLYLRVSPNNMPPKRKFKGTKAISNTPLKTPRKSASLLRLLLYAP